MIDVLISSILCKRLYFSIEIQFLWKVQSVFSNIV